MKSKEELRTALCALLRRMPDEVPQMMAEYGTATPQQAVEWARVHTDSAWHAFLFGLYEHATDEQRIARVRELFGIAADAPSPWLVRIDRFN